MIGLGVEASKIVFSHPIKSVNSLKYAKEMNLKKLVFENGDELKKVLKYYYDAEVFFRVEPKFSNAQIQLNNKFCADEKETIELIRLASELKANFIGFRFMSEVYVMMFIVFELLLNIFQN
jgi:ornithine decarboxylase